VEDGVGELNVELGWLNDGRDCLTIVTSLPPPPPPRVITRERERVCVFTGALLVVAGRAVGFDTVLPTLLREMAGPALLLRAGLGEDSVAGLDPLVPGRTAAVPPPAPEPIRPELGRLKVDADCGMGRTFEVAPPPAAADPEADRAAGSLGRVTARLAPSCTSRSGRPPTDAGPASGRIATRSMSPRERRTASR